MQLKLIACEILYREICATISRSINRVDVEFLPKGLHDIGQAGMLARLRDTLAAVDQSQSILVGSRRAPAGMWHVWQATVVV